MFWNYSTKDMLNINFVSLLQSVTAYITIHEPLNMQMERLYLAHLDNLQEELHHTMAVHLLFPTFHHGALSSALVFLLITPTCFLFPTF